MTAKPTTDIMREMQRLGQAIWIDYIRRSMLRSGELRQMVEDGVSGVTSNPTIFEKAIIGSTDYDAALGWLIEAGKGTQQIYESLAIGDIQMAADQLRPVYERTQGADGFASLECNPRLAYDTDGTIAEARRLFALLNRPNVLVKVPATPEGIPAIRRLIADGINVNITLIFSLDMYREVREAYIRGLEERLKSGGDIKNVSSVASFFLSRVDTVVDSQVEERIRQGHAGLKELPGKAAIANARVAYHDFRETFGSKRFAELKTRGARVQRPLWASTSTKNPAYSDLHYIEPLIGADTVNTMPPATLTAFRDHGTARATLEEGLLTARQTLAALTVAGISMKQVTDKLLADGVKAFADSFDQILQGIEEKKARLAAKRADSASQGTHVSDADSTLADLQQRDTVGRIWRKDYTVWQTDPAEITNRLGWLTVTDQMREQVPALTEFTREVCDGFRNIVLLGMGGSSLGPEVLCHTFRKLKGYPKLIVLDSTVPAWIQAVIDAIDPARTLFLVSSKSGTTLEVLCLYQYFRNLVQSAVGEKRTGQNFAAITDAGTPLAKMAAETGFRRVFLNPSDIGGRYSVLSYFGLVPAVLAGIDIATLLDRADRMRESCASSVPAAENPGAKLGAIMGTLAQRGRDKLTLVASPAIGSFGLWVEQLIAESTGKAGKGIIPVAGEPLAGIEDYGDDRLFVYLRLEGDNNAATDAAIKRIESSGQPVLRLELRDRYDLGAEFFRWEFATAVAGAILGIHPFNQPDVQKAKDMTDRVLREYQSHGHLHEATADRSLDSLLADARPGNYLAIMAYACDTPRINQGLTELRRKVTAKYHIATTLGYGPRFLHSTGQLHKGGPDKGLFLQLTASHKQYMPIPGKTYSFGVLADAQALGDWQTLNSLGRRVTRIHLGFQTVASIRRLTGTI